MDKIHVVLAVLAICIVATAMVGMATYMNSLKFGGKGLFKVVGVEAYDDENCTIVTTEISWGMLSPGTTQTRTIWIKNVGNVNVTLTYIVSDFIPANASEFLHPEWLYDNSTIAPNKTLLVTFTLAVDSDVHDIFDFSFVYTINAVE